MTDESIAIVGASCRFPGAEDLEKFWQLLASAGDAVTEVDDRRWSTRFYYHPDRSEAGKSYTWSAGLITGVDLFEPSFFGISPREAAQMDPQQRLLLELVWHAFEDAGIRAVAYDSDDTLSRRIVMAREMAVPVLAIIGGREMRDRRVSLRERDGSQADVPLAEAVSRLQAIARPGALMAEAL